MLTAKVMVLEPVSLPNAINDRDDRYSKIKLSQTLKHHHIAIILSYMSINSHALWYAFNFSEYSIKPV